MWSQVVLWWDALLLDPDAYRGVLGPGGVWAALGVVAVGGVSQLVGQSVVLFLNHVRPVRFLLSLGLAAGTFAAEVAVWGVGIWLTALAVAGLDLGVVDILAVVALAHAPFVLAFFLLLPYYGPPVQRALEIWTLLCLAVGLDAVTGWSLGELTLAIALGYAFTLLVKVALGRWVAALDRWLWRTATGARLRIRVEDALAAMKERAVGDARWFRS
ncbi:MAG: hypothetical protein ACFCVF_13010 [Kineosporiaceae bacterium]